VASTPDTTPTLSTTPAGLSQTSLAAVSFANLPGPNGATVNGVGNVNPVPQFSIQNIGQGVNVPGGLQDGVRSASAADPNFNAVQAQLQQQLVPVSALISPNGQGLTRLTGNRSSGGGDSAPVMPQGQFRALDGAVGLAEPDDLELSRLLGADGARLLAYGV
jgi:hypothetical protein